MNSNLQNRKWYKLVAVIIVSAHFLNHFMFKCSAMPTNGSFESLTDEQLRAMEGEQRNALEARVRGLENIRTLLDAATVHMQQYLSPFPSSSVNQPPASTSASAPYIIFHWFIVIQYFKRTSSINRTSTLLSFAARVLRLSTQAETRASSWCGRGVWNVWLHRHRKPL